MKTLVTFILFFVFVSSVQSSAEQEQQWSQKKMSANFRNTPVKEALELLSAKLKLKLFFQGDESEKLNLAFSKSSAKVILDKVARAMSADYRVKNGKLYFSIGAKVSDTQAPNPSSSNLSFSANSSQLRTKGGMTRFSLNYLKGTEVIKDLGKIVGKEGFVSYQGTGNSLAVYGDPKVVTKVKNYLEVFDVAPTQVLIEAQIIEINKTKARELGISWGALQRTDFSDISSGNTGSINNPTGTPIFQVGINIGSASNGDSLSAKIAGAESNGDAKVISRPKIITLNNTKATISSGITYSVKTLSAESSGSASLTGGLQSVSAGLDLQVTPTVVGGNRVRLTLNVVNSESDDSSAVDGIPGIVKNSANTEIIVQSGETATMAGLVKHSNSGGNGGVPYLKDLPFIGWLFRSSLSSERDKELMIFITPHIINGTPKKVRADLYLDKMKK